MTSMRAAVLLISFTSVMIGQPRWFAGGGPGASFLSNDSTSIVSASGGASAEYKHSMGALVHAFGGVHIAEYLSVQGAWNWNRNDLKLTGTATNGDAWQQQRDSSQHNGGVDLLIYFRHRTSHVRPFLTGGLNVSRFQSELKSQDLVRGSPLLPPARFTDTALGLRVAAGADFLLPNGWGVRYAFNEIQQTNVISKQLSPSGTGGMMNFQHLFGIVKYF